MHGLGGMTVQSMGIALDVVRSHLKPGTDRTAYSVQEAHIEYPRRHPNRTNDTSLDERPGW